MQTFYRTATLEELIDRTLITRRFALIVLTGFAALALFLAAAGLAGVIGGARLLADFSSASPPLIRWPSVARRG